MGGLPSRLDRPHSRHHRLVAGCRVLIMLMFMSLVFALRFSGTLSNYLRADKAKPPTCPCAYMYWMPHGPNR